MLNSIPGPVDLVDNTFRQICCALKLELELGHPPGAPYPTFRLFVCSGFSFAIPSEDLSQSRLEARFSGRPVLRFEPSFEVLNVNSVSNLGLSHNNRNSRLAAAHLIDPIVFAKYP
jgi:hypothetical protein